MAARVKITGLDKAGKDLKKKILDAVEESNFQDRLAKDVAAKVRRDGIEPDLAPSTIAYREKIVSKKGPGYAAGRSSLTLSGQLLGALTSVFDRAKSSFQFGVKDAIHKQYRYKTKKGKITKHGGTSRLVDIFEGLMKDRDITKVFEDEAFRKQEERRLVAAIKRYFK